LETPFFLTGAVRVRKCAEAEAILARISRFRDVDFDIGITEVDGGHVELTIDGCRDLNERGSRQLEEQLQALGPFAREAWSFAASTTWTSSTSSSPPAARPAWRRSATSTRRIAGS
jgi:hypothetical protein